ncbi:MAG: LLM class flavin-dependent oxidoreductase [Candidatus Lokiarchaeota archaeon]|nr:LLM class flavin-dependent oxidoreductase [Candidatus Lokiarchaeota archaeon]
MKLGVILFQNRPYPDLKRIAQRLDTSLWNTLWIPDEFQGDGVWHECWSVLASVAETTSRIRLGSLVTPIMLHHPALLAKRAITVDHIADGRIELGLGGGVRSAQDRIYKTLNFRDWAPKERVDRFEEQVKIIRELVAGRQITFNGEYYQTEECRLIPSPVQKPSIPITIGAIGKRMMTISVKYADRWNSYCSSEKSLQEVVEVIGGRLQFILETCDELERSPSTLIKSALALGRFWRDTFSSMENFESIVNAFCDIGLDELILYFPFDLKLIDTFWSVTENLSITKFI